MSEDNYPQSKQFLPACLEEHEVLHPEQAFLSVWSSEQPIRVGQTDT